MDVTTVPETPVPEGEAEILEVGLKDAMEDSGEEGGVYRVEDTLAQSARKSKAIMEHIVTTQLAEGRFVGDTVIEHELNKVKMPAPCHCTAHSLIQALAFAPTTIPLPPHPYLLGTARRCDPGVVFWSGWRDHSGWRPQSRGVGHQADPGNEWSRRSKGQSTTHNEGQKSESYCMP
jgi:hypothetical protein